jgi:hypothetical protein
MAWGGQRGGRWPQAACPARPPLKWQEDPCTGGPHTGRRKIGYGRHGGAGSMATPCHMPMIERY